MRSAGIGVDHGSLLTGKQMLLIDSPWRALRRFAAVLFIALVLAAVAMVVDWGDPESKAAWLGPETRVLESVFDDSFETPDGVAPDLARWRLTGKMFGVDIHNGRLRLEAAATADALSDAEPAAVLPAPLRDARLEADVILPNDTGEWFLTFGLRAPPTLDDAYMIVFHHRENGALQWRLQKYVDLKNTRLTRNVPLVGGLAYRIRLEVVEDHIRAAVQPLTAGPIPEGMWDLHAQDDDLDAPGTARPHLTKRAGQGRAQAYVDNFRVYAVAAQ